MNSPRISIERFRILLPVLALTICVSTFAADREGDPPAEGGARKDNPEAKAAARDGERGERKGPRDGEAEKRGPKDGEGEKRGPKDGEGGAKPEAARAAGDKGVPVNAKNSKDAKIFVAYDKDKNGSVSDEEIVAMMEGKQNSRGKREIRKAVDRADKDKDKVLNFDEFLWWQRIGRTDERARNR